MNPDTRSKEGKKEEGVTLHYCSQCEVQVPHSEKKLAKKRLV